jgi:uncharacterized membrane protein
MTTIGKENINRSIKYILMALITWLLIKYISKFVEPDQFIIIVPLMVSISYAILDRILPSTKCDN